MNQKPPIPPPTITSGGCIMSKVKTYIDSNKEKARHRSRIEDTRRTKANRIRKCKNDAYRWIRGGYYHETERTVYIVRNNERILYY